MGQSILWALPSAPQVEEIVSESDEPTLDISSPDPTKSVSDIDSSTSESAINSSALLSEWGSLLAWLLLQGQSQCRCVVDQHAAHFPLPLGLLFPGPFSCF